MSNFGQGGFATTKNVISGPPFIATAADNGLSVDTTTGRIVLGNDQLSVPGPAQLISTREVFTQGFSVIWNDAIAGTPQMLFTRGALAVANFLYQVGIQGELITKRAISVFEFDPTADAISDNFGVFELQIPPP